jgi:hypothetical protein
MGKQDGIESEMKSLKKKLELQYLNRIRR